MTEYEDSRPQPSALVEYQGIAYSLEVVIEKLRREGKLSRDESQSNSHFPPTTIDNPDNLPCVCCNSLKSVWGPGDWWPWIYVMGACLCVPCYWQLLDLGVEAVPWEAGVKDVQTVKEGVRIAPEPDGKESGCDEIERLIGTSVSREQVCWANLGSLSLYNKPLGDFIEDFGTTGRFSTLLFHRLVERGKEELSRN